MAAPRFVNELQENALWLSLSSLWAIGGTMAWLFSQGTSIGWIGSGSELTMLALFAAATTLALRLPILSNPPSTGLRSDPVVWDHAAWLLTSLAAVNWLGFFVLQTRGWSDAIPIVLLFGLAETWFHTQVWRCAALPWLRKSCENLFRLLNTLGREPAKEHQSATHPLDTNEHKSIERSTVQGLDDQGQRYISGRILVSLAAEQSTQTLSIAFSPPFAGQPEVDFECEGPGDGVSVHLIHSTPAGMRLGLRRTSSSGGIDFPLQWYAAEVELSEVPAPSASAGALP